MSDDLVFETRDEPQYAPSVKTTPVESDKELQTEIEKIPDKLAFKIGEVAELIGVKTYVLRYWETEFEAIKPQKSKNNQRIYTKKDVQTIMMVKKLLYRDRFSIEGARSALSCLRKDNKKARAIAGAMEHMESLRDQAQDLLLEIRQFKRSFE